MGLLVETLKRLTETKASQSQGNERNELNELTPHAPELIR
jgi:hypothetical protein